MATKQKNLSEYNQSEVPAAGKMKIGIVVAEWNMDITGALCSGAVNTLKKHGVKQKNIIIKYVPGSFELSLGAQWLLEYEKVNAVICIGCIIQGDTKHFDFICQSVTHGITELNLKFNLPVIFGVLTTNTTEPAIASAGTKKEKKGDKASRTATTVIKRYYTISKKS